MCEPSFLTDKNDHATNSYESICRCQMIEEKLEL